MNNNLSENLKKIRKDNNLSQEQLSEKLGVSRQAISKWESNQAYPEMDKILQLCKMFNLNIDDLLNNDIREVKGEQESKNNINKYIEDFLKFITNSINLIISMNFKSKIKCLFEQCILIFFLFLAFSFFGFILNNIFSDIFNFISYDIFYVIFSILRSIYYIIAIIISLIILIYVFNQRYLNYYLKFKNGVEDNKIKNNEDKEDKEDKEEKSIINEDISLKDEEKIIIRDPKHSEYRFINGILKSFIGFIKFCSLWMVLFFSITLITLIIISVVSFLIIKTGMFFAGIFVTLIGTTLINIVFLLILLNFIFNRKNNKKFIIYTFVISLISIGIGFGFISIGSLNFNYINNKKNDFYETKSFEIDMNENMKESIYFSYYYSNNYEFIEEERENIKIEYISPKNCYLNYSIYESEINLTNKCDNPIKIIKDYVKRLNNNQIFDLDFNNYDVKIYASKDNILKIINNN